MGTNLDYDCAEQFIYEFTLLGPFRDVKVFNKNNEGLGLIVGYLYEHQGSVVYAGDLAKVSGVSTARIAAALNKLENLGLIQREASDKDSRKTIVKITAEGRARAEEKRRDVVQYTAKLIDKVGKEDMDSFLRILRRIKQAMSEIREEGICV